MVVSSPSTISFSILYSDRLVEASVMASPPDRARLVSVSSTRIVWLKPPAVSASRALANRFSILYSDRLVEAASRWTTTRCLDRFSILYSDRLVEAQRRRPELPRDDPVSVSSTRIVWLKLTTALPNYLDIDQFQYPLLGSFG